MYWDMADGQVVLVTTQPLEGGPPIRSVYFVAEQSGEGYSNYCGGDGSE
jgi:hypothetical protein